MLSEPRSPVVAHASTPGELSERLAAERSGLPFVVWRDGGGRQQIRMIGPGERSVTVGRRAGSGVPIDSDDQVSRLHAELELIGQEWTVSDDGLSRNGTYVGRERVLGRRRLNDRDLITVGRTTLQFRYPGPDAELTTSVRRDGVAPRVSAADRCVLVALCRPLRDAAGALPATNQQIAEELGVSVPAVKKRLGALFERFGVAGLAQNQKRVALARAAIEGGLVARREL